MAGLDPVIHGPGCTMDAAGFASGKDPGIKSGHDSGVWGRRDGDGPIDPVRGLPATAAGTTSPPRPDPAFHSSVITGLDPVIHGR